MDRPAQYRKYPVRLRKSLVVITDPERPCVRVAKGSVARNQTLQLYEKDIDAMYRAIGQ